MRADSVRWILASLPDWLRCCSPLVLVPALIGELSFVLWLTVKGVIVARRKERAGLSNASL